MHDRFRILAEQSGFQFDQYNEATARKIEVLSKLIVLECVKVSERTGALNESDFEGEMIADAIKEHFGVKE